MPIPEHDHDSGYLPPGESVAAMDEVEGRFANNYKRRQIFQGLSEVVRRLVAHQVTTIWIAGSFVTEKLRPSDVDVIYVPPPGADTDAWDLLSFGRRKDLKAAYKVDLWPYPSPQPDKNNPFRRITIKDFFSSDEIGTPKGFLRLIELDKNDQE